MSEPFSKLAEVGVVVIGRNEGARLPACFSALEALVSRMIYVDSGSTDGSVALASARGIRVVQLDPAHPFSAARARNEGLAALVVASPNVELVQFVDGDCELATGWIDHAAAHLQAHPRIAVVCGRLRERFPERSIYNTLCDMEWDTPVGQALSCGGIAMVKIPAFTQVGGFRTGMIAGEEPELCVRLRSNGWQVWRLDAEMALHDAAMTSFRQWWRRSVRAGYAFAEGAMLHGAPPERHWVRESRSAWVWGLGLPLALLVLGLGWPAALWGLLVYPLQVARLALKGKGAFKPRLARAFFLVLGKFAEAAGQLKFLRQHLQGGPARLIEYK